MMKRRILVVFCLCLSFIFTFVFAHESAAFTLFDDTLVVSGYLRNETAFRLENRTWYDANTGLQNGKLEKGHLSRCRSTAWVELDWRLTPQLRFGSIARAHYEAKYSLDDRIPEASAAYNGDMDNWKSGPRGDNMREDFDLREWHLKYRKGGFTIKAGRQQVVWGEADNLPMADIINPLDLSWNFTFPTWEEIRIPLRMIDIIYEVPNSPHKYQIEVVLNPEDFRASTAAPYGDNWHFTGDGSWIPLFAMVPIPGINATQSVSGAIEGATRAGLPDKHSLRNFQGGARVRGLFGQWDTYLYYYHQRSQTPVFTTNPLPGMPFGPFDPFDATFGIRAHYPRINTVGATFNVYERRTATVFRGECGFTPDKPYSIFQGGFFGTRYIEKDTFSYMLGFDRPTWIPFLNPTHTFNLSGQFFQTFIFDLDDDVYTPGTNIGEDGDDDMTTYLTFLMMTEYLDATLKPDLVFVWNVDADNGFVVPKIGYEPVYSWRLELAVRFIWGDNYNSGLFGRVKNNDEVWLKVEYKF